MYAAELLYYGYINSLRSLCALDYVELYCCAFLKRLESFHLKTGVMNKYILAGLVGDESISLLIVEPLNSTLIHGDTSEKN